MDCFTRIFTSVGSPKLKEVYFKYCTSSALPNDMGIHGFPSMTTNGNEHFIWVKARVKLEHFA